MTEVRVVEVGPRDGLQNEPGRIELKTKQQLIARLVDSGLGYIEAGAFVSPRWVPQMEDSGELLNSFEPPHPAIMAALVPNARGFELARQSGADEIALFTAASETFSQKNTNCSIDEALQRFEQICQLAYQSELPVRGYISCVAGCPYEGEVPEEIVANIAQRLIDMGCREVSLADTTGVANAEQTRSLIRVVSQVVSVNQLAVHMHDTYGQAIANIYSALEEGVRVVDSAVAGLGGCPYAQGATGNVATEDVVYLLDSMGVETGISLDKLCDTGAWISEQLNRDYQSKAGRALLSKRLQSAGE